MGGMDDCISQLTAEMYYKCRVQKLLPMFQRDTPSLVFQQDASDITLFLCGFAASLLGAFHASSWIPVVLGFSAMLTMIMTYCGTREQVHATNRALAGITTIDVQWQALSNVDRRTPRFKAAIIGKTEALAFSVVQALAGSVAFAAGSDDERTENFKEEDPKASKTKADKKST